MNLKHKQYFTYRSPFVREFYRDPTGSFAHEALTWHSRLFWVDLDPMTVA